MPDPSTETTEAGDSTPAAPPFIYLNGYPGVGKLTVAEELCCVKILPNARLVSNHLLIDPAAAVFSRVEEEYQPLRRALRRQVLTAIATAKSTRHVTFIFTDSQSSDPVGRSAVQDYQDAAALRGSPLVSVILHCDLEENLDRLTRSNRGNGSNTKLTDQNILRDIRDAEDIFRFRDAYELELDVTSRSPEEAAAAIYGHVHKVLPDLGLLD